MCCGSSGRRESVMVWLEGGSWLGGRLRRIAPRCEKRTHPTKRVHGVIERERLMSDARSPLWTNSEGSPVLDQPGERCNIVVDGS